MAAPASLCAPATALCWSTFAHLRVDAAAPVGYMCGRLSTEKDVSILLLWLWWSCPCLRVARDRLLLVTAGLLVQTGRPFCVPRWIVYNP